MKKNMGTADRVIRTVIAIAIFALFSVGRITGAAAVILGIVALLLATGISGICPAYTLFHVSTRKEA